MTTVKNLYDAINEWAPFQTAMSFDNVGLLVGDGNASVTKGLVALDVTPFVLEEAVSMGAEVIISHHPVIFQPLRTLSSNSLPYRLAREGIAVISAHTNYDLAAEGVNVCLAKALGLTAVQPLTFDEKTGLPASFIGDLEQGYASKEFAAYVKEVLHCGGVKFTEGSRLVRKVAVSCGAGSSSVFAAIAAGADGFVTGESKHHELLAAKDAGITMVAAGHFNTENMAMGPLRQRLHQRFPEVDFVLSKATEPTCYL